MSEGPFHSDPMYAYEPEATFEEVLQPLKEFPEIKLPVSTKNQNINGRVSSIAGRIFLVKPLKGIAYLRVPSCCIATECSSFAWLLPVTKKIDSIYLTHNIKKIPP